MRFDKGTLVKVIVFGTICVIFTVILGVRLANVRLFSEKVVYEAEFENALGVIQGDSVKVAGVDVGRVEGTRIEDGLAVVEFSVDASVELTDESLAAIRWRNVLGQRFLYLYPGDGDGRRLGEGDRIDVDRTIAAGDIGEFLNNLGPILQAIDPEKANAFLQSVNTALVGNEAAARELIDNSAVLADDLAEMDDQITHLVDSSDEILAAFADQDAALGQILDDLDVVGGALERTTDDLNTVLTDFARVQEHLDRLLAENRTTIDELVGDLGTVANTLSENKSQLARTLCTLPMGVSGYFETTSWGEWFNVRIVEVIIKDRDNNVLVHERESKDQHGVDKRPVVWGCDGNEFDRHEGEGGGAFDDGGGDDDLLPAPSGSSDDIGAILRYLLDEEATDA